MSIKRHIFANSDHLAIYKNADSKEIVTHLSRGEWMGVVDENKNGLMVITTSGIGWIKNDCWESKPSRELKVSYINGALTYQAVA